MKDVLHVAMNGELIGQWFKSRDGHTEFHYEDSWLDSPRRRMLSLSLPLTQKVHRGAVVYNFFDNLLPDSSLIRSRIQQRFQISTGAPFDLLSVIGQDCVGAIQLYVEEPKLLKQVDAIPVSERDIATVLRNYQFLPLGMDSQQEFRISLAGAQEKTAFLYHQNQWYRPLHTTPTSHIFKLPMGLVGQGQLDLSKSIDNEWLCLQIMQTLGLNVPKADIAYFDDVQVLIVERFDRRWSQSGDWLIRLPQEDMCQASGIAPALKYESDGGLGIIAIVSQILKGSVEAQKDVRDFIKAQIVFWLLCAIDGHAKNFSIYLEAESRYRMAPIYDVISAYPLISPQGLQKKKIKMAMAWQGKNRHYHWNDIQVKHFYSTCQLLGFSAGYVDDILQEIVMLSKDIGSISVSDLDSQVSESILDGFQQKIRQLS